MSSSDAERETVPPPGMSGGAPRNLTWDAGVVDRAARVRRHGHPGAVVWFTGLSAAGKSTIASRLEAELFRRGRQVYRLDGDNLRHGLCRDLGFSPENRAENVRRAGEVAALFADAGLIVAASFISPYRRERREARAAAGPSPFVEVFVDCPIEVCVRRDPKQLYERALAGKVADFTGVSAPYEAPERPEIHLRTDQMGVDESVARVVAYLDENGILGRG